MMLSTTGEEMSAPVTSPKYRLRQACRACGSGSLRLVVDLGPTPLANSFLRSTAEFALEESFPLNVYICEGCSLVQLLEVVDPEILFRDYIYVTGTADSIVAHNHSYAATVTELLQLGSDDLVVEVASNNGQLLKCFQKLGVKVLGVEPATNIARMANDDGIETVNEFFSSTTAESIRSGYGPAKAVIGNNVLAHVDETKDFLLGCKMLLADDGQVITEVPYLREFVERTEFDTVYHEHLCYFGVNSLLSLCDSVGLSIRRIDEVAVHGGSIRMYAERAENANGHSAQVLAMAEAEKQAGLTSFATFDDFADRVRSIRRGLVQMLNELKADGRTIAAYGAPAKGNTLLNYCGIDSDVLDFAVDKNPLKVETFTPGSHLPVLPVSTLLERQPDYVLILAWNFADEIIEQQHEYLARGGRFIIPIPEPRIVEL
jgi:hypothetical protein